MVKQPLIYVLFLLGIVLTVTQAQENISEPAKELLYREGNHLYLLNSESGESRQLTGLETRFLNRWEWSPDGRYLAELVTDNQESGYFLRIYDVEQQAWLDNVNLFVAYSHAFKWSPDSKTIAYSYNQAGQGSLRLFDLVTGEARIIYENPAPIPGDLNFWGVGGGIWWAPDGKHLLSIDFYNISGGSDNYITLTKLNGDKQQLYGQYYAAYRPIWSPDGQWFLVILEKNYFSRTIEGYVTADDGEYGDLYLYNVDGSQYRITTTPASAETFIHWSADGAQFFFASQNTLNSVKIKNVHKGSSTPIPVDIEFTAPIVPKFFPYYEATWSQDGRQLAYLRGTDANTYQLFIIKQEGLVIVETMLAVLKHDAELIGWRPVNRQG